MRANFRPRGVIQVSRVAFAAVAIAWTGGSPLCISSRLLLVLPFLSATRPVLECSAQGQAEEVEDGGSRRRERGRRGALRSTKRRGRRG